MKITFVTVSPSGFHVDQLREEALKKNIEFEAINFSSFSDFESKMPDMGEVVIWRSSDLDIGVSRTLAMKLLSGKKLINLGVGNQPFTPKKFYQQKMIAKHLEYASIPTFTFTVKSELIKSIDEGILKFPFIQKPNQGSRGVDVRLIRTIDELEENRKSVKDYVYQNFIKNNGDFRAFMLGGVLLGVIKRVAKEGSVLNNVSQGAAAYVETDPKIIRNVRDIATKVASLFELQLCGIDIIFDEEEQKYKFLEANSVVQWKGFAPATGINVAEKIIEYCIQIASKDETFDKVKNYYDSNYPYLYAQKFHYASRLHLWTDKILYPIEIENFRKKDSLYDLEGGFIEKRIRSSIFEDPIYKSDKVSGKKLYRRLLKSKYPFVKKYSEVLAIYFFAKVLYGLNISDLIKKYIDTNELKTLALEVLTDKEAIANASTTVVNFLYFTRNYLRDQGEEINLQSDYFFKIVLDLLPGSDEETLDKKLYLLTHTLIGESEFYSKKMTLDKNTNDILKYLENSIQNNFFIFTLDMKLEFLVCCKMYGYDTFLEPIILNEAETSLGTLGNYLVDRCYYKDGKVGDNLYNAEHRSVLYLMARTNR